MPGISLVEAIHLIRILMEKYKERQRDLHMAFLDLEKAYDSVPRKVAPGIGNQHIPFCFDELPRGIQEDIPQCLIFADDIVLVSESTEAPVRRVEALVVEGLRRMGRPKLRWEDRVKHDMKELLLSENMTYDRSE
ncbi:hypothetical protein Tco_0045996 [Tanacetum coccineum]